MESGAPSVMTLGIILMLEWHALNWDTPEQVYTFNCCMILVRNWLMIIFGWLGSISRGAAYFDESSYGPVSVGNVQCSGLETRLQNCSLTRSPGSTCTHSRDAGVTCVGKVLCASGSKLVNTVPIFVDSLSEWWCQTCWWLNSLWRKSWALLQQCLGHSLWWQLGHTWC